MDIQTATNFFLYCTIINGGLLLFWALIVGFAPDLVYRTQRKWFPLSKETFSVVMYSFLALFKILFIILNLTPLLSLLIIKIW